MYFLEVEKIIKNSSKSSLVNLCMYFDLDSVGIKSVLKSRIFYYMSSQSYSVDFYWDNYFANIIFALSEK